MCFHWNTGVRVLSPKRHRRRSWDARQRQASLLVYQYFGQGSKTVVKRNDWRPWIRLFLKVVDTLKGGKYDPKATCSACKENMSLAAITLFLVYTTFLLSLLSAKCFVHSSTDRAQSWALVVIQAPWCWDEHKVCLPVYRHISPWGAILLHTRLYGPIPRDHVHTNGSSNFNKLY